MMIRTIRIEYVSGSQFNEGGTFAVDEQRHQVNVAVVEFAPKFEEWYARHEKILREVRQIRDCKGPETIYNELFRQFVPEVEEAVRAGRKILFKNPNPYRIHGACETRETSDGLWLMIDLSPAGWIFFHRERSDGRYRWVPMKDNCRVAQDASITAEYAGLTCRVGASWDGHAWTADEGWPWILLNPNQWVVDRKILELLEASDVNPLSGLLRSPQPVKTLANQLKDRIEEIHDLLVGTLTPR